MRKITVVGSGYVGLVDGVCLADKGHQVTCFDHDENKIALMKKGLSPIFEYGLEEMMQKNIGLGKLVFTADSKEAYQKADMILVGVGTPPKEDGSPDTSEVFKVVEEIAVKMDHDCLVVIKSTVPIGTCDSIQKNFDRRPNKKIWLEVASNPEFLSQGTALKDALNPVRIVIGTLSKKAENLLLEVYSPFKAPVVSVSLKSSEMIKYACNSFLALKISYINEVANFCEAVGANIKEVTEGMKYDSRIGSSFLNAGIGFGGSCLPKDSKAFSKSARKLGVPLKTLETAIEINEKQKVILFEKAKKVIGFFRDKKVTVLGLSFKPNTDDIRGSAAFDNIRLLLDAGAIVSAFDPKAMETFSKTEIGKQIRYCHSCQEALIGAEILFILTDWQEFLSIRPQDFILNMKTPIVFDGRNLFNPESMKNAGIRYFCIGS